MIDRSRDNVALFVPIKRCSAFEREVVRFSGSTYENNLFLRCANQISDVLSRILTCLLSFPSEAMRPWVRVAKVLSHERQHLVKNANLYILKVKTYRGSKGVVAWLSRYIGLTKLSLPAETSTTITGYKKRGFYLSHPWWWWLRRSAWKRLWITCG